MAENGRLGVAGGVFGCARWLRLVFSETCGEEDDDKGVARIARGAEGSGFEVGGSVNARNGRGWRGGE